MTDTASSAVFPLPALVGQDDLVLALLLCAIDPAIGGVLVRGEKGSGKTTAARGLSQVLAGDAPFIELPLGATEDRVVGSIDLRAALGAGQYRFEPGLLARADGGVLYVDEVNLLADHLVDVLLDAAATGVNRVERDGASHVHSARFVLIGSMNPEEGELRPQLLDRFGLSVAVAAPSDPGERAEAVRRRLAFDTDPAAFRAEWREAEAALASRLASCHPVPLEDGAGERVARLCAAAGVDGLRADLVVCRAAAALAGWLGRSFAGEQEIRRVAPLALAHRRRTPWDAPADATNDLEQLFDDTERGGGRSSFDRSDAPDPSVDGGATGTGSDLEGAAETRTAQGDDNGRGSEPPGPQDAGSEQTVPPRASGLLNPVGGSRGPNGASERSHGAARGRTRSVEGAPGRTVGARPVREGAAVGSAAPTATIVAGVERSARQGRRPVPLELAEEDLRQAVVRRPVGTLVVLAVDASGSMGVEGRLAAARGAVRSLLVDAYQRRDRVALVTFRDTDAEVVLRPTGSTEIASSRLDGMPTGGRTPLAAGITRGLEVARQAIGRGGSVGRALLVVVSDGRATWAEGGADPVDASLRAADAVRRSDVESLVVDCEQGRVPLGLAMPLAAAMGARHVVASELNEEGLVQVVRKALAVDRQL